MNTKTEEQQIRAEDAALAKLDRRDHEFAPERVTLGDIAPAGLAPSVGAQVSGATIFDVVEDLSSVGQVAVLRAVANGAICGAVFAQHQALTDDDEDRAEQAQQRAYQQAELYSYASDELAPLAMSQYDKAMTLEDALDFAGQQASDQRVPDELPDEFLEQLGISREALKLVDAQEQQKQKQRDAKLRESFRDRRDDIAAEVAGYIGGRSDNVVNDLVAEQHIALFNKAAKALSKRMTQLLAIRQRYDGALGEALLVSGDIKIVDKAFKHFRRENESETRAA